MGRPRLQRADALENLSARLRGWAIKRVLHHALDHEISIQDLVERAVDHELVRRDKLRSRRTTKQA